MTIRELIDQLQYFEGQLPADTEVRLAFQPSWPLQYHVGSVDAPDAADMSEFDVYHITTNDQGELEWYVSEPNEGDVAGPFPCQDDCLQWIDKQAAAEREAHPPIVYISEGGQVRDAPYLPGHVSRELGWR